MIKNMGVHGVGYKMTFADNLIHQDMERFGQLAEFEVEL